MIEDAASDFLQQLVNSTEGLRSFGSLNVHQLLVTVSAQHGFDVDDLNNAIWRAMQSKGYLQI